MLARNQQNARAAISRGAGLLITGAIFLAATAAASPTIATFAAPGADDTLPLSINRHGDIVGYYTTSSGGNHGFLREANGTIVNIDVPGAADTTATGINDSGAITGFWDDGNGTHGFAQSPGGTITTFDAGQSSGATYPTAVNRSGVIAGYVAYPGNQPVDGFARDTVGAVTTFDPAGYTVTFAEAINRKGAIAGQYEDSNGSDHGFIRRPSGNFILFDPPGSTLTFVTGINRTDSAGYYFDGTGTHGFVRAHDGGTIASFDPPGLSNSHVAGIDESGKVVGYAFMGTSLARGFVRRPNVTFAIFNVPGANETYPSAISHGNVTGYYLDNNGASGFLRTP